MLSPSQQEHRLPWNCVCVTTEIRDVMIFIFYRISSLFKYLNSPLSGPNQQREQGVLSPSSKDVVKLTLSLVDSDSSIVYNHLYDTFSPLNIQSKATS